MIPLCNGLYCDIAISLVKIILERCYVTGRRLGALHKSVDGVTTGIKYSILVTTT